MKSVLLIGLGRYGGNLAMNLNRLGHEVMAVDCVDERVSAVLPYVTNAQIGDCTNEEFLQSLGVGNYDVCFVAISGFQVSLEVTLLLKELGAKKVVSRAEYDVQEKFLLRNGADAVVFPEKLMAQWAAIRHTADHIMDYIEVDDDHAILELPVPKEWLGKTVVQLDIRKKFDINIVAMKENEKFYPVIAPNTLLTEQITLLVLGDIKSLKKCFKL